MITFEIIKELYPKAIVYPEYEKCICGISDNEFGNTVVCYDMDKMIDQMIENGMTYEDAKDHFCYNIECGVGSEYSPVLIERVEYGSKDN